MSLELNNETIPNGLRVKTFGHTVDGNTVHIGQYEISLDDFLEAAFYVLTNTDLVPGDTRLDFVDLVKRLEEIPGWERGKRRLNEIRP